MELLKKTIKSESEVLPGDVIKVDSFLNHQINTGLIYECGKAWFEKFKDMGVTKILTIETSGIAIATLTALHFDVPVVYAKKTRNAALGDEYLSTKVISYTHGQSYDVFLAKNLINLHL